MKCKLFKILILIFSIANLGLVQNSFAQEERPNILFIAIDDMNDWTGFLGGHPEARTPNLDRIADMGINFTNAHTSAPGCSPSRNSLLYGIEPFNSGLYPFYEHEIHETLMEKYTSLPKLLKDNGYLTFGSGKIHHGSLMDPREWTDYHKPMPIKKYSNQEKDFKKTTVQSIPIDQL